MARGVGALTDRLIRITTALVMVAVAVVAAIPSALSFQAGAKHGIAGERWRGLLGQNRPRSQQSGSIAFAPTPIQITDRSPSEFRWLGIAVTAS